MPYTFCSDVVLLLAAFYCKGPFARSAAGIYGSYLFLHLALTQQRPLYGAKGREGRNSIHTTQTCTVWWSSSLHITAKFHRSMTDIVCHVCKTGKHFSVPAAYFMLKSVIHAGKIDRTIEGARPLFPRSIHSCDLRT